MTDDSPTKIRSSLDEYDELQMAFVVAMIGSIKGHLQKAGIIGEPAYDLAGSIAFSVSVLIDQGKEKDANGPAIKPALCFLLPTEPDTLITAPGSSFIHEYAMGCVAEAYGK